MNLPTKFSYDLTRGELLFVHSDPCDSSCAFSLDGMPHIILSLSRRAYVKNVRLIIYSEDCKNEVLSKCFVYKQSVGAFDEYELSISKDELGVGLYFSRISLECLGKVLFGYRQGEKIAFSDDKNTSPNIQLSISDFSYEKPIGFYGGIIYQIFVDRFNRGGKVEKRADAVICDDWTGGVPEYPEYPGAPLKNNTFYGGTLDGIVDKLDHISSLGADIIYLSPIFEAASNHKYDTGDYMRVDAMFGGDEALKRLISACKKRGIKLILDGVFNHTGADSIYFNRYARYDSVGAYQSKDSEYSDWYTFKDFPDEYEAWWGIEILPRLNLSSASCSNYFLGQGGVIEKYADMGIDGLRLDVADELSDDFIASIKNIIGRNSASILYGEVWEDASNKIAYDTRKKYYLGKELDGVMNYPLRTGLIDYVLKSDTRALRYALTDIINNAPKRITDAQMNLLGSHDTPRILTTIGAKDPQGLPNSVLRTMRMSESERKYAQKLLSSLYCVLATLPGIPTVFYGDEAGLEGYSDPFNRMPYPWGSESQELLSAYRAVGALRRKNPVYKTGGFKLLLLTDELFAFKRFDSVSTLVTVYNNSKEDIVINFDIGAKDLMSNKASRAHILQSKCASVYKTNKNSEFTVAKHIETRKTK